jgi:DNA polymerase-3 subunit alpha
MRQSKARALCIRLNGNADASKLHSLLAPYRHANGLIVEVEYETEQTRCCIKLGESWRVSVPDDLLLTLSDWISPQAIEVNY